MCSLACGHTPEGFVVVFTCSFTNMLFCCSISFITSSINQLCVLICPYYNVWPVYCCFNKNYKVHNMTLHAGLANPTSLQSFMVWYCSVCESKKGTYGKPWPSLYTKYSRSSMKIGLSNAVVVNRLMNRGRIRFVYFLLVERICSPIGGNKMA